MKTTTYLVTNIAIEADRAKDKLPVDFVENDWLAKVYLRTAAFQSRDISFKTEQWPHKSINTLNTAYYNSKQPYDVNVFDCYHNSNSKVNKQFVDIDMQIMYPSTFYVELTDDDIEIAGSLEQAAYEQLIFTLPVDFIYREL